MRHHERLSELDDPQLRLRPLEREDASAWYAYLSLPGALEHTSWKLNSLADLEPLLDDYASTAPASPSRWAVVDKHDGRLLGSAGFHSLDVDHHRAEIGYDFAPEAWGRGIATATCRALTRFGFDTLGYTRIQASVLDTNLASRRVLEKSGYAYEGLLRSYRWIRGQARDFLLYARLPTDPNPGNRP